jgi:anti-sigma regulatory factor (Ser/Thr protein kinase)
MTVNQLEPESRMGKAAQVERLGAGRLLLRLAAVPENVAVVRETVRREAEAMGMGPREVDDLRTVVSEACNNVVLHAYPPEARERPLEIEMGRDGDSLEVVVRDRGKGIRPRTDSTPESLKLGLSLIGSLASCFQLRSGREQGTELAFRLPFAAP